MCPQIRKLFRFRGFIYLKPYKHITLSANTSPPPPPSKMVKNFKKFVGLNHPSHIGVHKLGSYIRGWIYLKLKNVLNSYLLYVSTNLKVILGDVSI